MGQYEEALDAFRSGENERTGELSTELLADARRIGDQAKQVDALCMLARVALRVGDLAEVRAWADEARACARSAGDVRLERMPLHMQAVAVRMTGDFAEARRLYQESIELNRSLGEERMVAAELHNLAYVELHDGQSDRALDLFRRARCEAKRIGFEGLNPYFVGDLAVAAAVNGDLTAAARLAGAAAAAFSGAGQVPDPDDAAEQQRLGDQLARDLSPDELRSLHAEGARLEPAQILGELTGDEPLA